ncbi:HAD family hydrolase [Acidobacteria bacterium AB60]|nr:HAD family hydrolase [Acidobacteria bacterium AB60]
MFPFDVILFDVGGVLLTNGWDRCERSHLMERFHLDPQEFERRHREANDPWERDVISAREYLDFTIFHEPRGFTHEDFLEALLAESVLLPDGGLGILQELAASGKWMLGTLNNEAREPNEYRFSRFGLRDYFDVAFSSCYMGLRKPQPIMYRHALDILGKPAERVLFIDDRNENAAAAAAAGMKAIRFEGAAQLRRELQTLGVL